MAVKDLNVWFFTDYGIVKAVNTISFFLKHGETLGLVGESGCGKSVTALSILKLIKAPGKFVGGSIKYKNMELTDKNETFYINHIRGKEISMIFQDPLTALNPSYTIGWQIKEAFILGKNKKESGKEIKDKTIDILRRVKIPDAEIQLTKYPHQLSGGMRQRAVIAIALASNPAILIADEPTTSLDVTVQAAILDLMEEFKFDFNISIIFITHDLNLVAERCNSVMVMYAGEIVECSDTESIFKKPRHPYTIGLLESTPNIGGKFHKITSIRGEVPNLIDLGNRCFFYERCFKRKKICNTEKPKFNEVDSDHYVRCYFPEENYFGNR